MVEVDQASRRVRLSGTVAVLSRMFGSSLELVTAPAPNGTPATFRQRTGGLSVPAALDGVVTAVLARRPRSRAHFQVALPAAVITSYTPPEIGQV